MNYLIFILKSALFDFSRNKGRTILTSLGILIGVLSVILLVAFGLGLKAYIKNQFESLGTNILAVVPGQVVQNGSFRSSPSSFANLIRFDEKDYANLKKISNAQYVIPAFTKAITVVAGGNTETTDLYASSEDLFPARNLTLALGSYFTKEDNDSRKKVAVIGPKIAEKLFGNGGDALEKQVKVDNQSFKIVGVLDSKGGGGFGGPDFDSFIYIPYKTGYIFNPDKKFATFILKAGSDQDIIAVKTEATDTLLGRYKSDEFQVIEATEILNAISSIFNILNSVLVAIAAISLLVGGIGIMNIMYVTVPERIKEIGIRRAIGARKKDILYQFLIESVILCLFGGLLAIVLAILITLGIQNFFPAYVSPESVLLALGVSSAIGIIFGVFPARRAANLSPIDAIRYE